jgi:hypothetical protein
MSGKRKKLLTEKILLGIIMISMPFAGLFAWVSIREGWRAAIDVCGIALFIVIWITVAFYFCEGNYGGDDERIDTSRK